MGGGGKQFCNTIFVKIFLQNVEDPNLIEQKPEESDEDLADDGKSMKSRTVVSKLSGKSKSKKELELAKRRAAK